MKATTSTATLMPMADPSLPQPYEVGRFNALKQGILSRYTGLSRESQGDYPCGFAVTCMVAEVNTVC